MDEYTSAPPTIAWTGDPGHDDVRNAYTYVRLGLIQHGGTQRVDGMLYIDRADDTDLAGRLALAIEGIVPMFSRSPVIGRAESTFDLPAR